MRVGDIIEQLLGSDLPVRLEAVDGTAMGPLDAPAKVTVRSIDAVRRIVHGAVGDLAALSPPGELGFARAYVCGDLDIEGDIFAVMQLRDRLPNVKLGTRPL